MASQEERKLQSAQKFKIKAKKLAVIALEKFEEDPSKKAVLLCEGAETSMDVFIYSTIYPDFFVMPVGGCTDIVRLVPMMRKIMNQDVFGIIDRDNCSKNQIRKLASEQYVYCTKLPFIENILCCPEVLKIICKEMNKDYTAVLKFVRGSFTSMLAEKVSFLNPFNLELPRDSEVQLIAISIVTSKNVINKNIDLSNVMYTFRNKSIVSLVADAMELHGRDAYYKFLREQVEGENNEKILQAIAKYLPIIKEEH